MTEDIYGSALTQMGADELEPDENTGPTKRKTSVVLSAATRRQLAWLAAQGHGNQSECIALAVDRMWNQEQHRKEIES